MILRHYSQDSLAFDPNRSYEISARDPYFKPVGLWLSVEGYVTDDQTWKTWCEGNDWGTETLQHATDFVLTRDANVLHLSTEDALRRFTRKYDMQPYPDIPSHRCIDWPRVKRDYDGIIVAPYQWSLRLEHAVNWYYCWDCASACIWNLAAIAPIEVTA